jgi:HAD superfamily hydrolase (TIGR01509 family)
MRDTLNTRGIPMTPQVPDGDFAAFLFDCDGTLAASMQLHYRSWLFAIEQQRGGFVPDWKTFCSCGGMSVEDTLAFWNKKFGVTLDAARVRADTDAFLEAELDSVEPCPEVVALARDAARRGIKLAVASGGMRSRVLRTLRAIGVEGLFTVIVAQEDVERVKPAPDLFLLAAARLGEPPAKCLVIEDSPRGAEAAEAAGMRCLLVEPR